ncbi:NUDIX hydrolase [Chitinophagaceae bacterium MMS25-I14]
MSPEKRFNVRVYGLWLQDGQVLACDELIRGRKVMKFPGGGLEMGEGAIDCIKREWVEELNLQIEVLGHFYTTDFFQASAFDNSQVISIYYLVKPAIPGGYVFPVSEAEQFVWLPVDEDLPAKITLPIDIRVAEMLAGLK